MSLILSGTDGLSDVDGSAATPAIRGTDANTGIFFPAADTIAFAEGGAECARFDSSGSFGIGTATPYRQFQVGNYSTNAIMALGSSPTSTGTLVFASADSAPGRYVGSIDYNHTSNYLSFTANASERMRLDASGRLGIGTTTMSTSENLVVSNGTVDLVMSPGAFSSGNTAMIGTKTNHAIAFAINTAQKMAIDTSGNLLVGTASQLGSGKVGFLQSASGQVLTMQNSNATPYGIVCAYTGAAPNSTISQFIYCDDTGGLRMEVRSNGGIANYTANNVVLSDRREKTNFAPAGSYLDKICAIPVQTFNYIDQNMEDDGGLTLGVVAQDVQAVAPELVTEGNWGSKDEPKMRFEIYQTDLQYALMKCIQEQQALITQLTARITALESA